MHAPRLLARLRHVLANPRQTDGRAAPCGHGCGTRSLRSRAAS